MPIHKLSRSIWAGFASGIILGLFLKVAEYLTSLKVYTLLLNIDYIPILSQLELSEIVEFVLHLVISILLSVALSIFLNSKEWSLSKKMSFVTAICVALGLLLFPTTSLSERTPELFDIPSLLLWLTGHLIYGLALGLLLRNTHNAPH